MSVKDEIGYVGDRSSKTMGIEPMNATFHPVGEWMKDSELEWEMLCFGPYKNGPGGGVGEWMGKGQGWKQERVQKSG